MPGEVRKIDELPPGGATDLPAVRLPFILGLAPEFCSRREAALRGGPSNRRVRLMDMTPAFVAAILEAPDDPTPRLVYSDWLKDQNDWTESRVLGHVTDHPGNDQFRLLAADWYEQAGDNDRAEFIRVQCELEKFTHTDAVRNRKYDARDGVSPEWQAAFDLHDREMKLLWKKAGTGERANWAAWCWAEARDEDGEPVRANGLGGFTVSPHGTAGLGENSCGCAVDTRVGLVRQLFRRGFVAEVHCRLETWMKHGPGIVRPQPIEVVRLTDRTPLPATETGVYAWGNKESLDNTFGSNNSSNNNALPSRVWHILRNHVTPRAVQWPEWKDYPTEQAAIDAASDALLQWARNNKEIS